MAFTIRFSNGETTQWHINDKKPARAMTNSVLLFGASDDELEEVRRQFSNIPITKGTHCWWTGELAQFMFNNIQFPK